MIKQVLTGLAAVAVISFAPGAASAQDAADVMLVHGIEGTTVDVAIDGNVVINDFEPGALADLSNYAGDTLTNLTIVDSATGDDVIDPVASFDVPDSGSSSIVAHLDADGDATLTVFTNNATATAEGKARLTVRHTAEAPAIDLVVGDARPVQGAINGDSAELELDIGDLAGAQIAPAGGDPIAALATLNLAANTNTIVYAIGSTADDTLDFVVQVVDLPISTVVTTTTVAATTTVAGATTTTVAGATTTTVAGATTTTVAVPTAVNTGSPIDGSSSLPLIATALGAVAIAGGALVARRRL